MSQTIDFDVIIVGSGPSGVSAAFPLVSAGLSVLMVDGGQVKRMEPPIGHYLDLRKTDLNQNEWMVGRNFHSLQQVNAVTPKLRVPTHSGVFDGFADANKIVANDFVAVGSLAQGGLSNAWGCGVACLTANEIAKFPVSPSEMQSSYKDIAKRIGISGGKDDDLSEFFGLDEWSDTEIPIDELQGNLFAKYSKNKKQLHTNGFRMGRSRLAVLTKPKLDRLACDRSGTCLWGCERGSLYSATHDIKQLLKLPGFNYKPGFLVEQVISNGDTVFVEGRGNQGKQLINAKKVLLAAGTLATTRLALKAINYKKLVKMQSCPTAAFMLWSPRYLGRQPDEAFGLGQLAFSLDLSSDIQGFGSLFNTLGIPVTEFGRYMPLGKRYSIDLLAQLLSSCVVGNLFLPGSLSDVSLQLNEKDQLVIQGGYNNEVEKLMRKAQHELRKNFWKLGALLLPTSFKIGSPGSDIHYAASLPMKANPSLGQTNEYGELVGGRGIHAIDGASLSFLPAKSHTLTIMANADRISKWIANELTKNQ
jgi:hypothetical protein